MSAKGIGCFAHIQELDIVLGDRYFPSSVIFARKLEEGENYPEHCGFSIPVIVSGREITFEFRYMTGEGKADHVSFYLMSNKGDAAKGDNPNILEMANWKDVQTLTVLGANDFGVYSLLAVDNDNGVRSYIRYLPDGKLPEFFNYQEVVEGMKSGVLDPGISVDVQVTPEMRRR